MGVKRDPLYRDLDKDFPVSEPYEYQEEVEDLGQKETVTVHKIKGPYVINHDGSVSPWSFDENPFTNSGGKIDGMSPSHHNVKHPWRYRSKPQQMIYILMAAKKNLKMRELLEAQSSQALASKVRVDLSDNAVGQKEI